MSRISDLRNNENNCVNIVKILELFCNGETKYIEMLVKLFPTKGDSTDVKVNAISVRTGIPTEKLKQLNTNEIEVLFYMVEDTMLLNSIRYFNRFCELNEQKQIEKNDLHSYKTFDEVENAVSDAEEKIRIKDLEKQINKVYEDDEWLLLIPLTYEASVKYGYGTKWCTASDTTSHQYQTYTRDGILIYVIHKGVEKIAVYKKHIDKNITFWNEKDKNLDSFLFNLPPMILEKIRETIDKYSKKSSNDDFIESSTALLNSMLGSKRKKITFGMDVASPSITALPPDPPEITIKGNPLIFKGVGAEKLLTDVLSKEIQVETVEKWAPTKIYDGLDNTGSMAEKWVSDSEARKEAISESISNKTTYQSALTKDLIQKVSTILSGLH